MYLLAKLLYPVTLVTCSSGNCQCQLSVS